MIIDELFEGPQMCPECGGISFSDLILAEKKDACYHKVKASAKVWPSAYASGRLVQCRKKGAANYGNKSEGVAEDNLNELDIFAPVTTYVRLANGTYVAANWRRNQNLSTASNSASFIDIKPLAPAAAKQLGLDQRLNDPEKKYTGAATIASGGPIQASGPLADRTINVVDIRDPKTAKNLGVPDTVFGKIAQWTQQQGQKQQGVAESNVFTDARMNAIKAGKDTFVVHGKTYQVTGDTTDEREAEDQLDEKWSQKYKSSINCANPKGFSQRAHCAGRKKNEDVAELDEGGDVFMPNIKNTPEYKAGFATGKLPVPYPEGTQQYASYYKGVIDKASPTLAKVGEGEQQKGADYRDPKEVDYDDEYDAMVARVKKLAGLGPMKTVYDPARRQYRNMPTAQQPKK
jgi:hypothetical protein